VSRGSVIHQINSWRMTSSAIAWRWTVMATQWRQTANCSKCELQWLWRCSHRRWHDMLVECSARASKQTCLNLIRCGMHNQWRSRSSGVLWSHLRAEQTSRAAAFVTDWSLLSWLLATLANVPLPWSRHVSTKDTTSDCSLLWDWLTNAADLTQYDKGHGSQNVRLHWCIRVNVNTQVTHWWCWHDGVITNSQCDLRHLIGRQYITHTHNRFTALFPGPPGWAGARKELMDFKADTHYPYIRAVHTGELFDTHTYGPYLRVHFWHP